jgi:hypothetical protein
VLCRTTIFGAHNLHNFRLRFRKCTCISEYTHASYENPYLYFYCTHTPHTFIVFFANKIIWLILPMIPIERLVGGSLRCSQDNPERDKLTNGEGYTRRRTSLVGLCQEGEGTKFWSKLLQSCMERPIQYPTHVKFCDKLLQLKTYPPSKLCQETDAQDASMHSPRIIRINASKN